MAVRPRVSARCRPVDGVNRCGVRRGEGRNKVRHSSALASLQLNEINQLTRALTFTEISLERLNV